MKTKSEGWNERISLDERSNISETKADLEIRTLQQEGCVGV